MQIRTAQLSKQNMNTYSLTDGPQWPLPAQAEDVLPVAPALPPLGATEAPAPPDTTTVRRKFCLKLYKPHGCQLKRMIVFCHYKMCSESFNLVDQ